MIIWDKFKVQNTEKTITIAATSVGLNIDQPLETISVAGALYITGNLQRSSSASAGIYFDNDAISMRGTTINYGSAKINSTATNSWLTGFSSSTATITHATITNATITNATITNATITSTATIAAADITQATIDTLSITNPVTLPTGSKFADTKLQPPSGLYLRPVHVGMWGDYTQFYLLTGTSSVTYNVTVVDGSTTTTFGPYNANTWEVKDGAINGNVTLNIYEGNNAVRSIPLGSISPVSQEKSGYLRPIDQFNLYSPPSIQRSCLLTEIDNVAVLATYWPPDTNIHSTTNKFKLDDEKLAVYLWAKQKGYISSYQKGPIEQYNATSVTASSLTGIIQFTKV